MALIIFEGPDNVGKTTQINLLKKFFINKGFNVHNLHYSNINTENIRIKSKSMYENAFKVFSSNSDIFISDRFHLGEYVYGQIYRNYKDADDIFEIEIPSIGNLLIVLIDEPENLIKREDGQSFSIKLENKIKEIELFKDAYEKSSLKKILINIKNLNIEQVHTKITEFINTYFYFEDDQRLFNISREQQKQQIFMNIAFEVSKLSRAKRLKVGAIIIKDNNILSFGYNGTPSGLDNTCEIGDCTKPEVLHAESNAILKCAKNGFSLNEATLYLTDSPCFDCAKLIIQAGIKTVYYSREYRNSEKSKELLMKSNILIKRI
jgi:dCMP deaminase